MVHVSEVEYILAQGGVVHMAPRAQLPCSKRDPSLSCCFFCQIAPLATGSGVVAGPSSPCTTMHLALAASNHFNGHEYHFLSSPFPPNHLPPKLRSTSINVVTIAEDKPITLDLRRSRPRPSPADLHRSDPRRIPLDLDLCGSRGHPRPPSGVASRRHASLAHFYRTKRRPIAS